MYNKFAIFDDCAVYIDDEKGFVKLVKFDKDLEQENKKINKGLVAANLDNTVQSFKKEIKSKNKKTNLLNKKRILNEIKNLESHLKFFEQRFDEEEKKLNCEYVPLKDISRIGSAMNAENEVNKNLQKRLK